MTQTQIDQPLESPLNPGLTSAFRKTLKGQAQTLPIFLKIGKQGLIPNIIKELDQAFIKKPLIKLTIEGERDTRLKISEMLCETLGITLISHIGSSLAFFKQP